MAVILTGLGSAIGGGVGGALDVSGVFLLAVVLMVVVVAGVVWGL